MASVHLARATDSRLGSPLVAIKRPHEHLAGDRSFLTMLVDEARLASAIRHPNVVQVRELGFDGGVPFIVMDYVEGASLAELRRELAREGRAIDTRVAVRVALDMLEGLAAAHSLRDDGGRPLRIIHRDVSPHNVLVGTDGRARITDFGIAKAEDRIQTTRTHEVKGKLAYLAPERVDKRRLCTVQSDVFSAAVVLWECFAGRRLFRSEALVDLLQEVTTGPIPRLAEIGAHVPPALDGVIARALSRDLHERYATAEVFARAIAEAAGSDGVGEHGDVARLVEAVFGERMTARHDRIRAAVGGGAFEELLRGAGLRRRDRSEPALDSPKVIAELAPPAPTSPYGVGSARRVRWPSAGWLWRAIGPASGLAAGIALGVGATWWIARPGVRALAISARSTTSEPSREVRADHGSPAIPAARIDEATSPVPPAPAASSTRDAVPRTAPSPEPVRHAAGRSSSAVGTLRDGFTKLN
jgi:serine/threonine-protein kinase